MAPKIFITGITGYIGGDVFFNIHQKHPEYEYAALIRTQGKAEEIKAKYPSVEFVVGGLDDYQVIKDQAAKADIVIHTAESADHEGSARAIAEGLVEGHTKEKPGYCLHTTGTGILNWEDMRLNRIGEESDRVYNDWDGVADLTNLPDDAFHRNVDKVVLECGAENGDRVKTALICPPTIYGKGRGPSNTRSLQAYALAEIILTEKYIPIVGKGKAVWHEVHVADLANLYLLLVEAAVAGNNDLEIWGEKGYFLVENGDFEWGDFAKKMGASAAELGFIPQPEPKAWDIGNPQTKNEYIAASWGLNSRGISKRARKVLGWKPVQPSLQAEIPTILKSEYAELSKA